MLDQFAYFLQKATSPVLNPIIFIERKLPKAQTKRRAQDLTLSTGSPGAQIGQPPESPTCISLLSFCLKISQSDWPSALLQALESNNGLFTTLILKLLFLFLSIHDASQK